MTNEGALTEIQYLLDPYPSVLRQEKWESGNKK